MTRQDEDLHVLLVDDEVDFLASTSTALERRKLRVSTAEHGDAALRLLQREAVDVVVLDVKMPGISGDELFSMIKQRWPRLPVIMLTGHGSVQHAFKSSREGVVEYLAKPCEIETIARVIRKTVARQRAKTTRTEDADDLRDIRVLVVDDEQELLEVLVLTLGRRGVRVATARSGASALERLEREDFDVILLDLKLQGEHGLALLERLKREHPSIEVIIHTGHPSAETAVHGMKNGAFDYLPKPTDTKMLLERLHAACRRRRRRAAEARKKAVQDILERQPE